MALAAYPTGLEQSPASSPEPLVVKSWYRCSSRITETILELYLESTEELLEVGKTPVELRIGSADGDKTFILSVRIGDVYKGAIGAWIVTLQDPSLPSADRGNYLLQPNRGYRPDGTGEADIPGMHSAQTGRIRKHGPERRYGPYFVPIPMLIGLAAPLLPGALAHHRLPASAGPHSLLAIGPENCPATFLPARVGSASVLE